MKKLFLYLLASFSFFFLVNNVSATSLVTSSEILEKTGKAVSQSAINECYSNNRNFMLVYSEGTTQFIGDYAFLCSTAPTTYIFIANTPWGQGYNFAYFDTTFHHVNDTASGVLYKNGTGALCTITTSGDCGQWGRKNYFTYYYSNFDVRYDWEGDYSSRAGQVKFSCNSNSCLSGSSNTPVINYVLQNAYSSADYNFNNIELNFSGNSLAFDEDNKFNFKLQAEANDPNNPLVPSLVSAKIYGLPSGSIDKIYKEITDIDITSLLTYELDTSLGQYIITGSMLGIPKLFDYSSLKIVFDFNNTSNGTVYVYDDFDDNYSLTDFNIYWTCERTFLYGYTKYTFPTDKSYAIISDDESISGRLYTSYNSTINDDVLFKVFNYNYVSDLLKEEIIPIGYLEDPYYVYYDFSLDYSNDKVILLHREKKTETNVFYVPSNFNVTFISDNNVDYSLITPNGSQTGSINQYLDKKEQDSFIYSITSSFNYFIEPITYIASLINSFFTGLPIGFKYLFVALFGLTVSLFIVRFLL